MLATRLSSVVPPGFAVSARHGAVTVESETAFGTTIFVAALVDQPRALNDQIRTAAYSVLNNAQDYVSEELRDMWPTNPMPAPHAEVVGNELRLWYGDQMELTLPAIPLDALDPSGSCR
jgi:hypothetical protein